MSVCVFCSVNKTEKQARGLSISHTQCAMNWMSVHKINLHTKLPHSISNQICRHQHLLKMVIIISSPMMSASNCTADCWCCCFFFVLHNLHWTFFFRYCCCCYFLSHFRSSVFSLFLSSFLIFFSLRIGSSPNAEGWIYIAYIHKTSKCVRTSKSTPQRR